MIIILKDTPDWQAYFSIWNKVLEVVPRRCPYCRRKHALIGHGKRKRQIIGFGRKRHILVQRMKCKYCGKTATVHPEFVIKRYRIVKPVIYKIKELYKTKVKLMWIPLELKRIFKCRILWVSNIARLAKVRI